MPFFMLVLKNVFWELSKILNLLLIITTNVTLEHKTSHKGPFFEIEIYASSECWINNISIDVWFGQYL